MMVCRKELGILFTVRLLMSKEILSFIVTNIPTEVLLTLLLKEKVLKKLFKIELTKMGKF